jgi:hypothetical protein
MSVQKIMTIFVLLGVLFVKDSWSAERLTQPWIKESELQSLQGIQGTRYSFEQLEKITDEIIQKNYINRPLSDGYPILHHILMERRDAKEKNQYLNLFKKVLQQKQTDKNICDKNKNTLLSVSVDHDDVESLNLLLEIGTDPNFTNSRGRTAFEHSLVQSSNPVIVRKLREVTEITPKIRQGFREDFETLLEEWDVEKVNMFLDLKLINLEDFAQNPEKSVVPTEIDHLFAEGFWIRTIQDLKKEIGILEEREKMPKEVDLEKLRHSNEKIKNYTPYSPATFVKKGIPVALFDASSAGVMIKTKGRTIPYWYDGHNEQLTRDMNYSKEKLDNGQPSGQFWEIKESDIAKTLQKMKDNYINDMVLNVQEEGNDKYKIFNDKRFQRGCSFSWNEGLFRYKKEDIFAIYVPDESYLKEAFDLRGLLQQPNLPFLFYKDGVIGL